MTKTRQLAIGMTIAAAVVTSLQFFGPSANPGGYHAAVMMAWVGSLMLWVSSILRK